MLDAINTNVIALQTQDNLQNSQSSLASSIERLSSGLRINSAQDDPAGLAIAARMTSQLNGLNQAGSNANTGVSMLQTADGGLASTTSLLQSMRGLAVEAANGTNSSSDLASLQAQITQLQAQVQQVATTTQYNGINLVDGSLSNLQFQVGANSGQTINFGIASAQETAIGNNSVVLNGVAGNAAGDAISDVGTAATAGTEVNNLQATTLSIDGNGQNYVVGGGSGIAVGASAQTVAADVNAGSATTGVTATASAQAVLSLTGSGNVNFNIVGTSTANISASYSASAGYASVVSAINEQTGNTGVTAALGQGGVVLSNSTGANIDIQNTGTTANINLEGFTSTGTVDSTNLVNLAAAGGADSAVIGGTLQFNSSNGFSVDDSVGTGLFSATGTTGSTLASVGSINVTTVTNGVPTGANSALLIIDAAINNINANRANIGALQNRFTASASNLQTSSLNLTSSLSTEQDTNFAAETTNLSRAQILQQAGTAMLAQANSLPNGVLALLR